MKLKIVALATAVCCGTPTVSLQAAQEYGYRDTGQALLVSCGTGGGANLPDTGNAGYCMGYIIGIAEGSHAIPGGNCYPVTASKAQMVDVVVKYLIAHPEWRARYAFPLVVAAIKEAFPCPSRTASLR